MVRHRVGFGGGWAWAAIAVCGTACSTPSEDRNARASADACPANSSCPIDAGVRGREAGTIVPREAGQCPSISNPVTFGAAGTAHGTGTVTAVLPIVGESCNAEYLTDGIEKGFGFAFDDGTSTSYLRVGVPWDRPLLHVGQKVSVEATDACAWFARDAARLVVRDEQGKLLIWIDWSGTEPPPPEVKLDTLTSCVAYEDDCSVSTIPTLRVEVGGAGAVIQNGVTQVGDYVVLSDGGSDVRMKDPGSCPSDYHFRTKSFAVIRGDLASLSAPRGCGGTACKSSEWCELPAGADCSELETKGVCKPRPTACDGKRDPVATCDGWADSVCSAESAGQTPVTNLLCALTGAWESPVQEPAGTCLETLNCANNELRPTRLGTNFPVYQLYCETGDGGGARCECRTTSSVLKTVSLPALPDCTPESAISICGFEPFSRPVGSL